MPNQPPMGILSTDTVTSLKFNVGYVRGRLEKHSKALSQSLDIVEKKAHDQESVSKRIVQTTPQCHLNLDDAFAVLRNHFVSPSKGQPSYSQNEIENMSVRRFNVPC